MVAFLSVLSLMDVKGWPPISIRRDEARTVVATKQPVGGSSDACRLSWHCADMFHCCRHVAILYIKSETKSESMIDGWP